MSSCRPPAPSTSPTSTRAHATWKSASVGLVRVLDDKHEAVGQWNPRLEDEDLQVGLRHMLLTRIFDDRMQRTQRQGKISFYMRCFGEEAVAVAQAMALQPGDMLFPSYRQQGIYMVRGKPLVELMCQLLSNTRDMCKGRQLPVMYHWNAGRIFSISGNLTTQFPQAVGWAMAAAIRNEDHIACTWIGEGSSAEADFHHGLLFAAVLPGAGDHEHRQQPVGHLHVPGNGRRRAALVRGARPGLRHRGHPRRRQRLPRGVRGHAVGRAARAHRRRPDAHRARHLSRRPRIPPATIHRVTGPRTTTSTGRSAIR